jgi:hypothetical protein
MAAKENFTVAWNEKDEIQLKHEAVCVRRHQHTGDEVSMLMRGKEKMCVYVCVGVEWSREERLWQLH